jgi:hypothetical protein
MKHMYLLLYRERFDDNGIISSVACLFKNAFSNSYYISSKVSLYSNTVISVTITVYFKIWEHGSPHFNNHRLLGF